MLIFVVTILEILTLLLLMPFMTALINGEGFSSGTQIGFLRRFFGLDIELTFGFHALALGLAVIMAGTARVVLLKYNSSISYRAGAELSRKILSNVLRQPLLWHLKVNSSQVISAMTVKCDVASDVIMLGVMFLNSAILILSISATLFVITPTGTLYVVLFFSFFYYILAKRNARHLRRNGDAISVGRTDVIRRLQETLRGIREIILDNSAGSSQKGYSQADLNLRDAQASNVLLSEAPRYILESLGIVIVISLSYGLLVVQADTVDSVLPILGVLGMGAIRLLPSVQYCYRSWAIISGNFTSLNEALDYCEISPPKPARVNKLAGESQSPQSSLSVPREFESLRLVNCGFSYGKGTKSVIDNVNIEIRVGDHLAIIGETGSGKSTLVDLVVGLILPTEGSVFLNNSDLRGLDSAARSSLFAYVPQSVLLYDDTILANICGARQSEPVDIDRVKQIVSLTQLEGLVDNLPRGLESRVGEHGARLSGGQRQRIAIARAMYKGAQIIIFDEATSALDEYTERKIIAALMGFPGLRASIHVTHRPSIVEHCNKVFNVVGGQVIELLNK